MRIVFICQWNPWRLDGGALIRNAWLLRALASRFEVDLVTADDDASEVPAEFATVCASISRFPRTMGFRGKALRALGALRANGSFYTSGSTSSALRAAVRQLTRHGDCVAMLDLRMIDAIDGSRVPFVYNAHNTEHQLLLRRAEHEPEPLRSLLAFEAARVARIEGRVIRNARLVASCSENDRRELLDLAPEATDRILVVPNGVDTHGYAAVAKTRGDARTVLITGSFDWRPNLIGLDWFLAEVLPALRDRLADGGYAIRIAGRMNDELVARLRGVEGITAVPNPRDMRTELQRARIVAAPIVASSGTRLRILEAWAAGRPVVTTGAGALGLHYCDGENLLIADRPLEFADAVGRVLDNVFLQERLRVAGLLRARDYDWGRIGGEFVDRAGPMLEAACGSSGERVPSAK